MKINHFNILNELNMLSHCPHLHNLAHTSQHTHPTEDNSQPGNSLYSIDRLHTDDLLTQ